MTKPGVVLLISSGLRPVPGGQSRYLYDLWSCLPGAPAIDAGLGSQVARVRLPLGTDLASKLLKPWVLLWHTWGLCRYQRVRAIHCGQAFSAGFAEYWCRRWPGFPGSEWPWCPRPLT
ncbi:MAG: hypothetical protein FJY95_22140 [Candidatus Handelsmanbacteria bacterium]|nr:hypothetical protein [Candidatus Handelsmanbacteria bacterium]